ncbi:hypothetical protein L1887_39081 [Cichorium endivia]|nr:hypothetical protein L1887_39081 [Cichorium endivia]
MLTTDIVLSTKKAIKPQTLRSNCAAVGRRLALGNISIGECVDGLGSSPVNMTMLEKLFVQIFERKDWIIDQIQRQADAYSEQLACRLLIDGITPPPCLLNPRFNSHPSVPHVLKSPTLSVEVFVPHGYANLQLNFDEMDGCDSSKVSSLVSKKRKLEGLLGQELAMENVVSSQSKYARTYSDECTNVETMDIGLEMNENTVVFVHYGLLGQECNFSIDHKSSGTFFEEQLPEANVHDDFDDECEKDETMNIGLDINENPVVKGVEENSRVSLHDDVAVFYEETVTEVDDVTLVLNLNKSEADDKTINETMPVYEDGILQDMDLEKHLSSSDCDYTFPNQQSFSSVQFSGTPLNWQSKNYYSSPVGKFWDRSASSSGSSENRLSSNLELTCFPIEEDPSSNEESENDQLEENKSANEEKIPITMSTEMEFVTKENDDDVADEIEQGIVPKIANHEPTSGSMNSVNVKVNIPKTHDKVKYKKHLVFLVLFTFNFLLHSSMASSQVQSFPPQNFTLLGDSYLRHGVAGLTLESNFLSASSGTITYTRPVRFSGDRTNSSASFSTRFYFFIVNMNPLSPFFISPEKRTLGSPGGYLGLVHSPRSTENRLFAIEYDTGLHPRIENPHNATDDTVITSPLVGFGVDSATKKYRKLIGLGVEVSGTALFLAILAFLGYISVMKIKATKNLEKILGNFGRIHSCMIAKDDLGKSDSEESANDALTALDGTTFDGTMIPEPEFTNVYEENLDSDFTQIETFSENVNVTSAVIMSDADAERGFGFVNENGSKELLFMKKSEREGFADKKDTTTPSNVFLKNVAASVDEQTPVNSQTSAAHEFGTSKSDFDEMLELDMNPISLSFSDDGLHDSRLSLSDDGLHDSRETTVIDDDSFDSERVGSFCTMSQILVHWRPTEEEAIYNYFISNIAAYVPTVQQKGERYISKVKALEAGKAAKRREDKKEKERRMKKEAFKMERERAKKEKEREMELNRKIKQEEMKKREADMAARKKQREKEERAKKRKEEKRWRL